LQQRRLSVGLCCSPHANVKTPSLISRLPRGRNKRGVKAPKSKSFAGPGHGIIQISPCYRRFQNPTECLRRQKLRSRDPCKPLLRQSAQVVNWNSPARDENDAGSERSNSDAKKKIEIMAIHLGLLNNLGTGGGRLLKVPVRKLELWQRPLSFPCPNAFFCSRRGVSSHMAATDFGTHLRPLAAPGTKYPPDRPRKVLPPRNLDAELHHPSNPSCELPAWSCRLVAQISERLKVILLLPSTSLVFRLAFPSLSRLRQISSSPCLFAFRLCNCTS
jgi:hypothetical protein